MFQSSYTIVFGAFCTVLLITSTLVAKPIIPTSTDEEVDPHAYLKAYGYLENEEGTTVSEGILSLVSSDNIDNDRSALEKFQRSMGLNVTGVADTATRQQMARPRCGTADTTQSLRQHLIIDDSIESSLWNKTLRTYRFGSFASYDQISRPVQESIIADAFYEWSKHVPLTFEKVCETCTADIIIDFIDDEFDNHRHDKETVRFRPREFAHAALPDSFYPTFIHFNKKLTFTENYDPRTSHTNLFHAVVHEIGHTLGLTDEQYDKASVMYKFYPKPYNRVRRDYLAIFDQKLLQAEYGKREKNIISACSTWSAEPQAIDITPVGSKSIQSLSRMKVDTTAVNGSFHPLLKQFLVDHQQLHHNASRHLHQHKDLSTTRQSNQSRPTTQSLLQANNFKASGSVEEDRSGKFKAIFTDRFHNIYISDYVNNRVLKYDTSIATQQQPTIVAENLSAPRGIYVTNDGNILYVVDSKGVHRFKLDEKETNVGASTLLFCLDSSSVIYSMIVDEDDFNTIYLYDSARQRIQQCRHTLDEWKCNTIISFTDKIDGANQCASMVLDSNGDISLLDSDSNLILLFKHNQNSCQSVSSSTQSSSSSTTSTPSTTTTTTQQKSTNQVTVSSITQSSTTTPSNYVSSMILHGLIHGGPGGSPFDDSVDLKLSPLKACIGVEVFWTADNLFALRFIYGQNDNSSSKVYHGNSYTMKHLFNETFMMRGGERISKVIWYTGTNGWVHGNQEGTPVYYILGIQFHTTNGRISSFYGSQKGQMFSESYEGYTLGYAKGRSGWLVDRLQFVWYSQRTETIPEHQHFSASCPSWKSLFILSAVYRSQSNSTSCSKDVTNIVRKLCFSQTSCSFLVHNNVLTIDPCIGILKELYVLYSCNARQSSFGSVLQNTDYPYNDIQMNGRWNIEDVETIETCGEYCLQEKKCVGVAYSPKGRLCWLKHTMRSSIALEDRNSMLVLRHN